MPNIRLVIEYDGSQFHGWQIQPAVRTVQGELTRLLELITREKIAVVHASGRTDAGVHARGQVVNFELQQQPDLELIKHSINGLMKRELAVLSADLVAPEFHARRRAISKTYCYKILHRKAPAVLDRARVWHVGYELDINLMQAEAQQLLGEHDFSAFRSKDCGSDNLVKNIYAVGFEWHAPFLDFRIKGSGFLKNMVRIITGTLVDIGRGHLPPGLIAALLKGTDRNQAGVTAPPQGLYLEKVEYGPDFDL